MLWSIGAFPRAFPSAPRCWTLLGAPARSLGAGVAIGSNHVVAARVLQPQRLKVESAVSALRLRGVRQGVLRRVDGLASLGSKN